MKKRILGILTVVLALSMVFSMVSCDTGNKGGGGNTYSITYNANGWTGGGIPGNKTIAKDTEISAANIPDLTSTAEQTFIGWALTPTGTTPITATYVVESDITLYVIFLNKVATGEEITIRYNANGWTGDGVPADTKTGESGKAIGAENLPTLTDTATQKFSGWATSSTGTVISDTYTPEGDLILYVIWTRISTNLVTISFNLGYEGAETIAPIQVEPGVPIGTLPTPATREGFMFDGWWNVSFATQYTATSAFAASATLYAKWADTTLTGEDAFELLYLQNGAYAIYQFDIPQGNTLADYDAVTFDFKISAAGKVIWDRVGFRGMRLYGVFTDSDSVESANTDYELPEIKFINLNDHNTPYRILNPNQAAIDAVKNNVEADAWYNIRHSLAGDNNAELVPPQKPAEQTGTIYLALGLSCQTINKGKDRGDSFLQLVKDIKLLPKEEAPVINAQKPGEAYAQFLSFKDPIVFEWRGEPTAENIANWETLVPQYVEVPFDRGDPPADDDLAAVELGGFTYINRGNPNNQRGWASFSEAGRANDQSYTGEASSVAFANFRNAWYLVLETQRKFTGGAQIIWMGPAGGWISNAVTSSAGVPDEDLLTISGDDEEGYVLKFFLPKALGEYSKFFEENTEWAAFCIQYWGADNANLTSANGLGITRAYLLVDKDEVEGNATGIALGLSFELGTAPASGALIDDVVLDGDNLIVTAVSDLTGFRWYVDGVKNEEAEGTLTIPAVSGTTVTLYAQRGSSWASQAVKITVSE